MQIKKGDLFTSTAAALGHGVNVRGLMGAGIAKTFKQKYPDNYMAYSAVCAVGCLEGGDAFLYPAVDNDDNDRELRVIVNMASQEEPGPVAQYDWLFESALTAAKKLYALDVKTCAIPEIGCGIGGLAWYKVEQLLLAVEILVPGFEWEVWKYEPVVSRG